ncbi:MAG TPA: hypothetical protein VKQ73_15030 [Stellaceae bacterium]|nr:hypothetical protein [Stellaceae bacterium]
MRALFTSYLIVGLALILVGFYGTGDCPSRNTDFLSDLVFVISWPGYLYKNVLQGPMTPMQWMHAQACAGGVVIFQ